MDILFSHHPYCSTSQVWNCVMALSETTHWVFPWEYPDCILSSPGTQLRLSPHYQSQHSKHTRSEAFRSCWYLSTPSQTPGSLEFLPFHDHSLNHIQCNRPPAGVYFLWPDVEAWSFDGLCFSGLHRVLMPYSYLPPDVIITSSCSAPIFSPFWRRPLR